MITDEGKISGFALILLALSLLLLPLGWVGGMVLAMAIHEGCHYFAIRLCGGNVHRVNIGVHGIRMEVSGLTNWQELLCALAGPTGGLLLLFAARWVPRTAVCAAFQSLFNLLPIYPLDGGRAVRCFVNQFLSRPKAERLCVWVEAVCLSGILCLGFYGTFALHLGLLPTLVALFFVQRSFSGKRLANRCGFRYNRENLFE